MHDLWILEDEESSIFVFQDSLKDLYHLTIFRSRDTFLGALRSKRKPKLILLDLMLEDGCALTLFTDPGLKAEQKLLSNIPVLVVSAVDDPNLMHSCFNVGAADFISKPFSKNELRVKIERLLKQAEKPLSHLKDIILDAESHTLKGAGQTTEPLTSKEFRILSVMMDAKEARTHRSEIETRVWRDTYVKQKTLEVHISNIRKKVRKVGIDIVCQPPFYSTIELIKPIHEESN